MSETVSFKAHRFMLANSQSPVVYASVEERAVVYRLADDKTFRLTRQESDEVGVPMFAHLVAVA